MINAEKGRFKIDLECGKTVTLKGRTRDIPVLTVVLYMAIVASLILVYVPGIGLRYHGSYRWLNLLFVRIQPSEFAKTAIVIIMSVWLERIGNRCRYFKEGVGYSLLLLAPVVILVLRSHLSPRLQPLGKCWPHRSGLFLRCIPAPFH